MTRAQHLKRKRAIEKRLRAGHPPLGDAAAMGGHGLDPAIVAAARDLKVRLGTLRAWNRDAETARRAWAVDWSVYKPQPPEKVVASAVKTPEQQRLDRLQLDALRHKDRADRLARDLREAHRKLNRADDLRREVFGLDAARVEMPAWSKRPPKAARSSGLPILFTSDFHWGETIDPDAIDGVNAYGPDVARTRYQRLIDKTITMSFDYTVAPDYPGILYLRAGDTISGDIHAELSRTNALASVPAAVDVAAHEQAGIERLADRFGRVTVVSLTGNHGRNTGKEKPSKAVTQTSYDWLIAQMIEKHFKARGDERVTFITPASADYLFQIWGWRFLATHGDRIGSSGGQGFIGPGAPIIRGMKKVTDYYAGLGQTLDTILMGHFHVAMETDRGFANGSLAGYSEYGRDGRYMPTPPIQWLLGVTPDHGVTTRWKLFLDERPRQALPDGDPLALGAL